MTAKIFLLFLRGFGGNVELASAGFTYSHCITPRLPNIKNHQDKSIFAPQRNFLTSNWFICMDDKRTYQAKGLHLP